MLDVEPDTSQVNGAVSKVSVVRMRNANVIKDMLRLCHVL